MFVYDCEQEKWAEVPDEPISETVPEPKEEQIDYGEAVDGKIRERYSISEEFAILRQKEEKPEEYSAYYAYCEECKAKIKEMIAESNSEAETPDSGEVIK